MCFQRKSVDFVIGHKHFAEGAQEHYGFHKGDLVWQNLDNIDLRASWAYKSQSSKPTLSLRQSKRDKLIESYTLYKT